MKISVALCTYNGEKFLNEQLESIYNQTLVPDEVVICDEQSTDGTAQIVKDWSEKLPIKFEVNASRLGTVKNFEKAISLCTGDIIFLCDQDDFWLPEKIEKMVTELKNSDSLAIFCNAALVDHNLAPLHKDMWTEMRFRTEQQSQWANGRSLELMLMGNRVTGCCLAFKKELASMAMPFPTEIEDWIHDGWLALVGVLKGSVRLFPEHLVLYRQHAAQQIGAQQKDLGEVPNLMQRLKRPREEKQKNYRAKAEQWQVLFFELMKRQVDQPKLLTVKEFVEYNKTRGYLSNQFFARFSQVLLEASQGSYFKFKDQDASAKAPFMAILGDLME